MEVSKYQPEPYMDEIFHIAQAQKFCDGRYSEVKNTYCLIPNPCFLYNICHNAILGSQNQNQKIFNEKLANRNYNIKHRR